LVGRHAETVFGKEFLCVEREKRAELHTGETDVAFLEEDLYTVEGGSMTVESRVESIAFENGERGRVGVVRDVTDRVERERRLRETTSQLAAATEAGAVGTWEWHVGDGEVVVGPSFAETFGVDPDAARDGLSVERFLSAVHEADRDRVKRKVEAAIANCEVYEAEYRVRDAAGDRRWVLARGRVECNEDGAPVSFPGVITDITERKRAERKLTRQRERLAALNQLNDVVGDITGAVIEQSTREEIEEIVCERLATLDSYAFAWMGGIDARTETVRLRTEAGVEGYLDGITISIDPDDERSQGPTGRAVIEEAVKATQDVREESSHDPWREHVREHGFRSSAAIPVMHEGTVYGVLNVYADRPNAFTGEERAVVGRLGEVIGHAIASVERKRALSSDEVVELGFRVPDVFDALDLPVTFDRIVTVGDGVFLAYGTAPSAAMEGLEALATDETVSHWDSVSTLSEDGDRTRFEARLVDPPVVSAVAAYGGYIDEAGVEGGDFYARVHLAPTTDVGAVNEAVTDVSPGAEMVARRQVTRQDTDRRGWVGTVAENLTNRQWVTLEAAFHSGYFGWPRDANGEAVADSLGIAPSTFHHHLRKAQHGLLSAVFDDRDRESVTETR
jgi:PAS domain S-box-containing protein